MNLNITTYWQKLLVFGNNEYLEHNLVVFGDNLALNSLHWFVLKRMISLYFKIVVSSNNFNFLVRAVESW